MCDKLTDFIQPDLPMSTARISVDRLKAAGRCQLLGFPVDRLKAADRCQLRGFPVDGLKAADRCQLLGFPVDRLKAADRCQLRGFPSWLTWHSENSDGLGRPGSPGTLRIATAWDVLAHQTL